MSDKSKDSPEQQGPQNQERRQSGDNSHTLLQSAPEDESEKDMEQIIADLIASRDPDEEELERIIADLIEQKHAAEEGSAEYHFVMRQLSGLRFTRELAGPIMEELDPFGWGATQPLPSTENPEGRLVQPFRKAGSGPEREPF
jgi:hypothetical protein